MFWAPEFGHSYRYTGIKIPLDTSLLCISFYIKLCDECVYISQKLLLQIFRFLASFNFLYRFYKIFIHLTIVGAGETLKTWCNLWKIWDREKSCAMDGNNLSPPLLMLFVSVWEFLGTSLGVAIVPTCYKINWGGGGSLISAKWIIPGFLEVFLETDLVSIIYVRYCKRMYIYHL